MDSITHFALGACIGEAFLDKKIGKKALLWGGLAQSIPDADFIAGFWMPLSEELLAHRGFTHSILFLLLITPVMAFAGRSLHRDLPISLNRWMLFFGIEILVHIFLDGFNNYGTGWFEPFHHCRFSFNTMYVADPFFSFWPALAAIVLLLIPVMSPRRTFWMKLGIILPVVYLAYASVNKLKIDHDTRKVLAERKIPYTRYFTTPAPLNNWLWYVVAGNDSGYHVGFRSLFDPPHTLHFEYFPRQDELLDTLKHHDDLKNLIRFSQEFYTVEKYGDSLVFNDLRFGQIIGWKDPREKFVFHYFLQHPESNELVVQRGRFAKWDKEIALALLRRAIGKDARD